MYTEFARVTVDAVGGPENIRHVTHCATRLRFQLVDPSRADKERIEQLPEAVGVLESQGQFQVIIGPGVPDAYKAVAAIPGVPSDDSDERPASDVKLSKAASGSWLDRVLAAISAIFTPYIPVLASVGIIKGLLAVAVQFNWLADTSNTYAILSAAGNAMIYFFPVLLAFTAAKQFGANPYVGATIGAALMEPNLTAINITGEHLNFLGIPFVGQSFANTVIPIIIGMWAFAYLERGLKKVLPQLLHLLLVPVVSLVVMVPLMLLVFGPIGFAIANGVATGYDWLVQYPVILSVIFGGFFVFVIAIGAHWLVTPLLLAILADQGKEYALAAGGMGNYAILGVLLAVLLVSQDKATRTVAGSAAFVNGIAGITEPGIYGVIVKSKKYFVGVIAGGLVGGLICGLFDVYVTAFAFSGVLGAPAFLASPRAVPYFVAVFCSIAVGFLVTLLLERLIRPAAGSPTPEAPRRRPTAAPPCRPPRPQHLGRPPHGLPPPVLAPAPGSRDDQEPHRGDADGRLLRGQGPRRRGHRDHRARDRRARPLFVLQRRRAGRVLQVRGRVHPAQGADGAPGGGQGVAGDLPRRPARPGEGLRARAGVLRPRGRRRGARHDRAGHGRRRRDVGCHRAQRP
jgi:PTS system beta-glucosides-specific IIC component